MSIVKDYIPKKLQRWVFISCASLLILWVGCILLSAYLSTEIENRIRSSHAKVASVELSLLNRSLGIHQLEWSPLPDSLSKDSHFIKVKHLSIEGIQLHTLLFSNHLQVNKVSADGGIIKYNKNNRTGKFAISKYKSIQIKDISLTNIDTHIQRDTLSSIFFTLVTCRINTVKVRSDSIQGFSYSLEQAEALLEKISINQHPGMYRGTIARIHVNTIDKRIRIDSAELIPNFSKYEFAHRAGKEMGRISLLIPRLTIEGLQFARLADSAFVASKIAIESFDLFAFRDKRMPFLRNHTVELPMKSLLKLPYFIKVDSVLISKSLITIEEFPENGVASGLITFNEVAATLAGLTNRFKLGDPPYAELKATALLMNTGKTEVMFKLPLDGTSTYAAKGTISAIDVKEFNPILTPLANIRVESGYLNKLTFNFDYNEFVSKGYTDIDYQDLHLISLHTDTHSTNKIKTLFLNALVKNKRSQSLSRNERNGVIDIKRDRKRFIFNVWWKSILDGIKSSIR